MSNRTGVGMDDPVDQEVMGGARLAWASATDVGNVRSLNEDSMLTEPPIFVVADGMGGHDSGEVASALTIDRMRHLVESGPPAIDSISAELRHINALLRTAGSGEYHSTMGTTTVGMSVVDNGGVPSWLIFNIGDSRAYCMSDGSLVQISRDHSYVQDLVDAGQIDRAEARTHQHRNVVTRALGADDEVQPDYWVRPLRPQERYLLCSDGLTGELSDDIIAEVLDAGFPATETVDCLIEMALEAGGRDNVTAVVVDVLEVPSWEDGTTGPRQQRRTRKVTARRDQLQPPAVRPRRSGLISDVPHAERQERPERAIEAPAISAVPRPDAAPVPGDPAVEQTPSIIVAMPADLGTRPEVAQSTTPFAAETVAEPVSSPNQPDGQDGPVDDG